MAVKKRVIKKKAPAKKGPVKKKAQPRKAGRPSILTKKIGALLCSRLIEIGSLRKVCEVADMPSKTSVFRWLAKSDEEGAGEEYIAFRNQYARARELSKDFRFDQLDHELREIAYMPLIDGDDKPITDKNGDAVMVLTAQSVQMAKLHLDAFKWQSSKENPKKYGDKIAVGGADDLPPIKAVVLSDEELKAELEKYGIKQ